MNSKRRSHKIKPNSFDAKDLRFSKNFAELFRMDAKQIENELRTIAKRLEIVASHLASVAKTSDVEFPATSLTLVEKRICLRCDEKIPEDDEAIRGNHNKCYKAIDREIKSGKFSEADAIRAGKLTPAKKGGRKPSQNAVKTFLTVQEAKSLYAEKAEVPTKPKASNRPASK
jgi:hypothetical protein